MPEENKPQGEQAAPQPEVKSGVDAASEALEARSDAGTVSKEKKELEGQLAEVKKLRAELAQQTTELKAAVEEAAKYGRSYAGAAVKAEETEEQRVTREAKELLKGTGFESYLG